MVAGRRIRFTAVLVGVVFALTGFSSHGHGGHSGSSGHKSDSSSGGGCSSSKTRSRTDSSNNNSNGSGNSSPTPSPSKTAPPAHAEVVTCAGPGRAEAVLKVTSDVSAERTLDVPLTFEGANGVVEGTSVRVTLKGRESRNVTVKMLHADKAGDVRRCVVGRIG